MAAQLYFLSLYLNMASQWGVELSNTLGEVNTILNQEDYATCLYKFKVTGEPRVISVFNVSNVIAYEKIVEELASLGDVFVTSGPMIWYQTFAKFLGVNESLLAVGDDSLKDDVEVFWLDFKLEYPGISTEELLNMWKREATAGLTARQTNGHMELFKVVAERRIHAFLGGDAALLDGLSFQLPIMQENGNGVTVVTRRLQRLDSYCKQMTESI